MWKGKPTESNIVLDMLGLILKLWIIPRQSPSRIDLERPVSGPFRVALHELKQRSINVGVVISSRPFPRADGQSRRLGQEGLIHNGAWACQQKMFEWVLMKIVRMIS